MTDGNLTERRFDMYKVLIAVAVLLCIGIGAHAQGTVIDAGWELDGNCVINWWMVVELDSIGYYIRTDLPGSAKFEKGPCGPPQQEAYSTSGSIVFEAGTNHWRLSGGWQKEGTYGWLAFLTPTFQYRAFTPVYKGNDEFVGNINYPTWPGCENSVKPICGSGGHGDPHEE